MKFVEGHRTWRHVLRQLVVALGHSPLTAQHRPASLPTLIRNVPDQLHISQISVKWGDLLVLMMGLQVPPPGHGPQRQLYTLLRAAQMGCF